MKSTAKSKENKQTSIYKQNTKIAMKSCNCTQIRTFSTTQ